MSSCGEYGSHRFKTYVTNEPSDTCVRCGTVHADIGRTDARQPIDPVMVKLLVDAAYVCGYRAGRDATDDQRQLENDIAYKSGRVCEMCSGTGWLDPEHPDYGVTDVEAEP